MISTRTEADELRDIIIKARLQINYLELAKTGGLYLEGAAPEFFRDAATGIDDLIADRLADLERATEALELFDAAQAYGERPKYALVTEGGASI